MALQRIDRMTKSPVVGLKYLVPTIVYVGWTRLNVWPVLGQRHEDTEHLSFPHLHYHVDLRFLTRRQVRWIEARDQRPIEHTVAAVPLNRGRDEPPPERPEYLPLVCRRAEHGYPIARAEESAGFRNLWNAYAGQQCADSKRGWICPHKLFPLGSIAPVDGVITCPLHGLRIDPETGVCIGADTTPETKRSAA